MNKEAKTNYDIHPVLKQRWSPRAFAEKQVELEKIHRLFEAARWAPSNNNLQPWRFIIGFKGDETHAKIISVLTEANAEWADKAPVLILVVGKKVNHKGDPNKLFSFDLAQATASMAFQATVDGINVRQITGLIPRKAFDVFAIHDLYGAVCALAVGYPGDPETLSNPLKKQEKAERTRNPIEDVVYTVKFGQKANIF
jgi:nitroreductase